MQEGGMFETKQATGSWGEEAAVLTARNAGARIVARNFRCRLGEIDLIFEHRGTLVFAEVKTRRGERGHGSGLDAVTRTKQRRIVSTARYYLMRRSVDLERVRFDVFEVRPGPQVHWVEAAFDADR
jgi:putative endonuclease